MTRETEHDRPDRGSRSQPSDENRAEGGLEVEDRALDSTAGGQSASSIQKKKDDLDRGQIDKIG